MIVSGGGLSTDHSGNAVFIKSNDHYLVSVKVLSKIFRGKFMSGLMKLSLADSNGNLWVCDQDKGCVRCFNMEDEVLATIDGETIGDDQNNRIAPSAFAISPSGIVAIADVRSRQVKILEIK